MWVCVYWILFFFSTIRGSRNVSVSIVTATIKAIFILWNKTAPVSWFISVYIILSSIDCIFNSFHTAVYNRGSVSLMFILMVCFKYLGLKHQRSHDNPLNFKIQRLQNYGGCWLLELNQLIDVRSKICPATGKWRRYYVYVITYPTSLCEDPHTHTQSLSIFMNTRCRHGQLGDFDINDQSPGLG